MTDEPAGDGEGLTTPEPFLDAPGMSALLRGLGVSADDIETARAHRHLELLSIEHLVMPDAPVLDVHGVSAATGLSVELIGQLWRSLGFVEPRPGDHLFTEVDVEMLRTIGQLLDLGLIDGTLVVQMARVIGSSLARVASALIDSIDPGEPVDRRAGLAPGPDDFAAVAPMLLPTLVQVMDYVWRRHVQAEARNRMNRDHAGTDPDQRVVGFADLVGFTALSQQVSAHELAAVVDRFEGIAYDTITRRGGRVVKMIGDEVMFSVAEVGDAAAIALTLSETYRDDDELSDVRVGLAAGPVLVREADLYGPVVNRASRIVSLAFPGTVVCSGEVHELLGDDDAYTWRPIGTRTLKNIGKVPLFVLRRSTPVEPEPSSRARSEARRDRRRAARIEEIAARREERLRERGADPDGGPAEGDASGSEDRGPR